MSRQNELNPACHWLLEWARWHYLTWSGLRAASHKEIVFFFHKINPLVSKLVGSRWLFLKAYGPQLCLGP